MKRLRVAHAARVLRSAARRTHGESVRPSEETFHDAASSRVCGEPPQTARGPRALPGVAAITLLLSCIADAASPQLSAITPPGAQRGSEVELTITGQRLQDAKGLLFYSPGLEVEKIAAADGGKLKATVKIASDCALGEHALRVWTASGLSDLALFFVGLFPAAEEKEPNNDAAHAQPIATNTTVNGVIKEEDIDYFAIDAKKGQPITAEIEGIRLGRAMFDPQLAILTKDGRILASNDDNALFLQDPLVTMVAPEDGTYFIAVRESAWGGNDKCAYRLHAGTFPQPTAAYPAGGEVGEELALKLIGDAQGVIETCVKLPDTADESFRVSAERNGEFAPAANAIRVSPFPNVLEAEPNNGVKQATATDKSLPLAFNGIIEQKSDADFFTFAAKKDEQLDLQVYARRLRSALDSVLTVFDSAGKQLANNDDAAGPDSALRFRAPADGNYCLAVKDQLGRGGAAFVYRVEVTRTRGQIAVTIPEIVKNTQERQSIVVPRGNRFATMLRVKRSDFDGEFSLAANDLPSGASLVVGPVAGDSMPVVFEAAADAPVDGKLAELQARPPDSAKSPVGYYEQSVDLVRGQPNDTVYYKTDVEKLAVSVAEEAPCRLEVVQPKVPILQNGAMNLRVLATRKEGFNGPIKISMLYNPPGCGSEATVTIPEGKNEAAIPLSANGDAKTRAWKIAVIGSCDAGKGAVWVSSQLADMEVAKPFVTAQIERASAEQGQSATVVCKLAPGVSFEGKAKIELLGLPNKTSAAAMEITSADREVKFPVATESGTPAGQSKGLFCRITFVRDGEQMVENTGHGGVLRIDPPAAMASAQKP